MDDFYKNTDTVSQDIYIPILMNKSQISIILCYVRRKFCYRRFVRKKKSIENKTSLRCHDNNRII